MQETMRLQNSAREDEISQQVCGEAGTLRRHRITAMPRTTTYYTQIPDFGEAAGA